MVAVAGGAVLEAANRAVVAGAGLVVWLRAEVATLADRVGSGEGRPLLDGDAPGGTDPALRAAPTRSTRLVAEVTVDVDGRSPDEVVDAIVAALGGGGGSAGAAADA